MAEDLPLLKASARRGIDQILYEMLIYEDRVVGISGTQKIMLCLDGDTCFRIDKNSLKIWFCNAQEEKKESFLVGGQK